MALCSRPRRRCFANTREIALVRGHQRCVCVSRVRPDSDADLGRAIAQENHIPRPFPWLAKPPPYHPGHGHPSQLPNDWRQCYPIFLTSNLRADRDIYKPLFAISSRQCNYCICGYFDLHYDHRLARAPTATDLWMSLPLRDLYHKCGDH